MNMRELKRIWGRRAKLAKQVELLELGKAGGVYHKRKRTSGAMRQACSGGGQRRAFVEAPAAQEGGEERDEEMLMTKVKRVRSSELKPIFDEIKITFEDWRLGGQYVDGDDLMTEFGTVCERKMSELKRSHFFSKISNS